MSRHRRKIHADPTYESGRSPAEWMAVHLDFPPDVLEGGLRLELRGRHALTVHGCRRILDYSREEIRLSMKDCILLIRGKRLGCSSYLAGAVGIDGLIDALTFEDHGDGGSPNKEDDPCC